MSSKRNGNGRVLGLLFGLSLLASGYILATFVPLRDVAEAIPGLGALVPRTQLNPDRVMHTQTIDFRNLADLKQQLNDREARIAEREKTLQAREAIETRMGKDLETSRQQIALMQQQIAKLVTEVDAAEAKNVKRLARVYNTMDADEASTLVHTMSDEEVVSIFSAMNERQVGKILGAYAAKGDENATRAAILVERIHQFVQQKREAKKAAPAAAAAPAAS